MKLLSALDHSSRFRKSSPVSEFDLASLAHRIERYGLDTIASADLAELGRRARRIGLHPEVAALLTDTDAPRVVRDRAFALIHRRLVAVAPVGTDPRPASAA